MQLKVVPSSVVVQNESDCSATGEPFNVLELEKEIVAAARKIVERDKSVGAILLECTELPPAAAAVQNAVRLLVWDDTT